MTPTNSSSDSASYLLTHETLSPLFTPPAQSQIAEPPKLSKRKERCLILEDFDRPPGYESPSQTSALLKRRLQALTKDSTFHELRPLQIPQQRMMRSTKRIARKILNSNAT